MTMYQQINPNKNEAGAPVFTRPECYSVYLQAEAEKYDFISTARSVGATVTGVSGCGIGFYIQIQATPDQAAAINRIFTGGGDAA